jgi:ribosomal protein S18 acetylase RimI-like enzyme
MILSAEKLAEVLPAGVTLRPVVGSDTEHLCALYASTRIEELAPLLWDDAMKAAFLASQFEAQTAHYDRHYPKAERLVIESNGVFAGRLYLDDLGSEIRVVDIALLPAYRGRGIGRVLIGEVQRAAEALGKGVGIHVEKHNPARRLYVRLGLEPTSEFGVYDFLLWRPPGESSPG